MCNMVEIFLTLFLILAFSAQWTEPYLHSGGRLAHSILLTIFISMAADVVDFVEYANDEK